MTLLQRRRWLTEQRVLSSGGGNRRFLQAGLPLLEDEVEVQLLNAAHLRNVPGRKTDLPDSAWIARLVEHDLARATARNREQDH